MKQLIFGCTLMLAGIIGAVGWLIAYASLIAPGARSSLFSVFTQADGIAVILFLLAAVCGALIAIFERKKK